MGKLYKKFFKRMITCIKQDMKKKDGKWTIEDLEKFEKEFNDCIEVQLIGAVKCVKRKDGVCFHENTGIVFNFDNITALAIGKLDKEFIVPLTFDDAMLCASNGWVFDVTSVDQQYHDVVKKNKETEKYMRMRKLE